MKQDTMKHNESQLGQPSTWRVIRDQDKRDVLRYGFDSQEDAERAAKDLHDPGQLFTYSVRQIFE